ncbi:MAG TPA: class I SAM-dependent methyltransferase [Dongiaceae bacterium]|nr:class I SAM-dependent methyltransferase [Dongiaceae bacterium]
MKSSEIVKDYWSNINGLPPEIVGVYGMGGGGACEAPYRHFFEFRHLERIVSLHRDMTVLELGCGNGRWAFSFAPHVKKYVGVDISPAMLSYARTKAEDMKLDNVTFIECPLTEFTCTDKFDLIYFSGVSQYVEDCDMEKVLSNLVPAMSERAIILDRSTANLFSREVSITDSYFSIYRTPDEINDLMKSIGYQLVYRKRSYRFLRMPPFLNRPGINAAVASFITHCQPYSFYLMLAFSAFLDAIRPIPFEGGQRTHDFLLFRRA